jgi:anaerobic selenocysteine-containing dehydrogenase
MPIITACSMDCGDSCSLAVDPEKRTLRGNPDHPFTRGFCCKKGAKYFERIDSDERITTPLIREGGSFRETDWGEALDLVAARLDAARQVPGSVLHVHGYGYRGVMATASSVFFRAIGATTVHGSVCDDTGITAAVRDFGVLHQNDPTDLLNASRIINWGRDLTRCSIHQLDLVKRARKNGTEVLSISPGGDNMDEFSDLTIRVRPGTDRFLAAAVLKLYLESGELNPWVLTRTANWPAMRGLIDGLNLADLCAASEVTPTDVETVYDWYADTGNAATLIGWGLQRYVYGGQNVRFINALALVSGNVGVPGGGSYFNISSARNLNSWGHLVDGYEANAKRRSFLIHDLPGEMDRADPSIDFVWVDGMNLVNQVPDSLAMADALRRPFTVCVDCFMNDTALAADVILPPALMFEREDVIGSCLHNYVNHEAQAVPPRGNIRVDFDFLADLGLRLAEPVRLPDVDACLREGLRESGISLDELRSRGFVKANHPPIAFENLKFGHPDGLYRFPEELTPEPAAPATFPLRLLTLVDGKYLQSQVPEKDQAGYPEVVISPDCLGCQELAPEKDVYLVTPLGAMRVLVRFDETLHPGAVVFRRSGWMKYGRVPNVVIQPRSTDMGDGCAYYSQECRLENR